MPPHDFKCKQCGNCCLHLTGAINVCVSEEDLQVWRDNLRFDILEWVDAIHLGEDQYVYDIWINPKTGDAVIRCPWLRKLPKQDKYICRINEFKPEHCRNYPLSIEHAEKTGCKGFDPVDALKVSKVSPELPGTSYGVLPQGEKND